jgi:hypothetical protein
MLGCHDVQCWTESTVDLREAVEVMTVGDVTTHPKLSASWNKQFVHLQIQITPTRYAWLIRRKVLERSPQRWQ